MARSEGDLGSQLRANLRRLRRGTGLSQAELGTRAGIDRKEVQRLEGAGGGEMRLATALRLAHSVGASLEDLLDRIYWDPGEIAPTPAARRPGSERLAGFFLVLPPGMSAFEPPALREPVSGRAAATAAIGARVREARTRRHLTQSALAASVGLGREGLSLIERGATETTVEVVLALARSLHLPPGFLITGIASRPERVGGKRLWDPDPPAAASARPAASREDIAARIGANLAHLRGKSGLTLRQLGEAAECDRSQVQRVESGRQLVNLPSLARLASGLNARPDLLVSGIAWDVESGAFQVSAAPIEEPAWRERLGESARLTRRSLGASQREVAGRASMGRGDVGEFENGRRAFRIFTAARLAGALGVELAELLAGMVDWYVRPLPPPELAPGERPPTRAERDALLARMWCEGRPEVDIADHLAMSAAAVGPYVRELRDAGRQLPYRRAPRTPDEVAARLRRGSANR